MPIHDKRPHQVNRQRQHEEIDDVDVQSHPRHPEIGDEPLYHRVLVPPKSLIELKADVVEQKNEEHENQGALEQLPGIESPITFEVGLFGKECFHSFLECHCIKSLHVEKKTALSAFADPWKSGALPPPFPSMAESKVLFLVLKSNRVEALP